jgi:hypothetical protein
MVKSVGVLSASHAFSRRLESRDVMLGDSSLISAVL